MTMPNIRVVYCRMEHRANLLWIPPDSDYNIKEVSMAAKQYITKYNYNCKCNYKYRYKYKYKYNIKEVTKPTAKQYNIMTIPIPNTIAT